MHGFVGKEFDATRPKKNIFAWGSDGANKIHHVHRYQSSHTEFIEDMCSYIALGERIFYKTDQKHGLANTEVLYSSNHNLLRTIGFITVLMAVPCLDRSMA